MVIDALALMQHQNQILIEASDIYGNTYIERFMRLIDTTKRRA